MSDQRETRQAYRDHLVELMAADPRVVCLDSDTGLFAGVDFGAARERYVNVGIAEQNLMGVAAGLAASGMVPYVNTMATFATTRAAESIKIDIAYAALGVRIVATHAGLSAGHLGPTHHALEDLSVIRAMPNMTVVVPGDSEATVSLLTQLADRPGPAYVRLGRKATPPLPAGTPPAALGRLQTVRGGEPARVTIVATGPLPTLRACHAAGALEADGIPALVLQAHTLKPFDVAGLLRYVSGAELVVTVEEHWRTGGLGSAIAEALAESEPRRILRIGVPDVFAPVVGTQEELLDGAGLSVEGIVDRVRLALRDWTSVRAVSASAWPGLVRKGD
ncbi:transketolase C-terminal domain-containing protein [Nonomuraea sp. NPDC052116]|uniref:transketolase family protein n=1 Tax=Nonomuraea sp. NPDC052116 TaxID=3155665 RepID=UPI0034416126